MENIKGEYIEKPKCKYCNIDLSHDWLGGDYTLLICKGKECWEELKSNRGKS